VRPTWTRLGIVAAALVAALSLVAIAGFDLEATVVAAWRGSFGSAFAITSGTLKRAIPLVVLGIAVAAAFRAGVLNIGADGQFLAGATAAVSLGLALPTHTPRVVALPLEASAAIAAGGGWAFIAAVLRRRFAVTEVVSTLLLNFVALNLVGFLVRGPLQEPTHAFPQSASLPDLARIPRLIAGQPLHWGIIATVFIAIGAWWVFDRTATGFRARAAGAGPAAAASAGQIDVPLTQSRALVASGALAGFAGFVEACGVTYALYEGLSPGYGYTAIAVALLGNLRPHAIVAAAVLFGALGSAVDAMQRDAGVPAELATIVAAFVVLGVLITPTARRSHGLAHPSASS
jgi:simple sugar transport system permease protein